jgi:hypothetical protein
MRRCCESSPTIGSRVPTAAGRARPPWERAAVNGMELVPNAGVIGREDDCRVFVLIGVTGIELVIPRL